MSRPVTTKTKQKRPRRQYVVALHLTPAEKLRIGRLAFEDNRSDSNFVRLALVAAGILEPRTKPETNGRGS